MNIRVVVCDDNEDDLKLELDVINSSIGMVVKDYEIRKYNNARNFYKDIDELVEYDIILLDIDMPEISGIDIAEKIIDKSTVANIIFVTNRSDLVFDAIHYRPFRFVRKEKIHEELAEAMVSACKKIKDEMLLYEFGSGKDNIKIKIIDIVYLESKTHYLHIHTKDEISVIRGKISDYENKLSGFGFIRIHQGYLVNVRSIFTITSKGITLDNGENLPISRKNVDQIKKIHLNYVRRFVRGIH